KTAPYYFMFGHYWTARAMKQGPKDMRSLYVNCMRGYILAAQEADGTFKDFTGTKAYRVYATALGVLCMHELICSEPDPAFSVPKNLKNETVLTPTQPSSAASSPSDKAPEKTDKK